MGERKDGSVKCAKRGCENAGRWYPVVEFRPPGMFGYKGKAVEASLPSVLYCEQCKDVEPPGGFKFLYDQVLSKMKIAVDLSRTTVRWMDSESVEGKRHAAELKRGEH